MGKILIFITCSILILLVGCAKDSAQKQLSDEQIRDAAIREGRNSGLVFERYDIVIDSGNNEWQQMSTRIDLNSIKDKELLQTNSYQSVCFKFKSDMPGLSGNNIWYFIDKKNGKLLTTYSEEMP